MKFSIDLPLSLNETGQRENNEDSVFPQKNSATSGDRLFLVCDGVGGIEKGEIASSLVCNDLAAFVSGNTPSPLTEQFFLDAFSHAQSSIDGYITEHPDAGGMATTLTLLSLNESGATVMWCGDSRVYQLRDGKIIFRTADHSFVGELVRNGLITEDEAAVHPKKNVITRAMQGHLAKTVRPEIIHITDVKAGDQFFLCSDGITESISSTALERLISENSHENVIDKIAEICQVNSRDNYSCYLIKIESVIGSANEMLYTGEKISNEAVLVDAQLIDEKPVQLNNPQKKFSLQDMGAGGKILLVVVLLGVLFAIWYFGLRKPADSANQAKPARVAAVKSKGPAAADLVARIEKIISHTEDSLTSDSLDVAQELLRDTIIPASTARNLALQVNDLRKLCSLLDAVETDSLPKKGSGLKYYKARLDSIIDFKPKSKGLKMDNFVSQAKELKKKIK